MDDQRRFRRGDKGDPPSEGVRIIGADEAAQAMERDDVVSRRGEDTPRFGDRPEQPPAGPRPALRFPLDAAADPSRIERPPVDPAPDPVTGPVELPHWTDPPTGEVPAVLIGSSPSFGDDDDIEDDNVDAWSSFSTSTPRWRDADDDWADDDFVTSLAEHSQEVRLGALNDDEPSTDDDDYYGYDDLEQRIDERTADVGAESDGTEVIDRPRWRDEDSWSASSERDEWAGEDDQDRDPESNYDQYGDDLEGESSGNADADADGYEYDDDFDTDDFDADDEDANFVEDEPAVLRIGQTPSTGDERQTEDLDQVRSEGSRRPHDDHVVDSYDLDPPSGGDRDMVAAVAVGAGLGVAALVALAIDARLMVVIVAGILAYAAFEYFTQLNKAEWETAGLVGVVACGAMPIAAYWRGPHAVTMVLFVTLAALFAWFLVGAGGRDPHVMESSGATMLGVVWIGVLGSSAGAMLALPKGRGLLITAILGTVAYDAGGLFIGKYMGHNALSAVSPNKTREGALGGMGLACIITLICVGVANLGPWNGVVGALLLGIGVACAAPLGDLFQSQLKRDLRIKDMGSILPGHGGVLDRFDGMLFVLPTVFWLTYAIGLS